MPASAYRIPIDYNEEWECLQIQWPKSEDWRGMLRSLLYELTRGRTWDADTGSIKDTQAVGWEIFDRNFDPPLCSGNVPPPADVPTEAPHYGLPGTGTGSDTSEGNEDCDMSCITNLEIEDGVLYAYYGPCCRVAIGAVAELQADMPPIPDDYLPPDVTDWACRKAYAAGKFLEDIAYQVVAHKTDFFTALASGLRANVGYVSWANTDIIEFWSFAFAFEETLPGYELTWSSEDTEAIICQWKSLIADTSDPLTSDEFDNMRAVANSLMGKGFQGSVWDSVMRNTGKKRFNDVVTSGLFNDEASCLCPENTAGNMLIPAGYAWNHVYDFRIDDYGWALLDSPDSVYTPGVGFQTIAIERYQTMPQLRKTVGMSGGSADVRYFGVLATEWPFAPGAGGVGPQWIGETGSIKWYDALFLSQPVIQVLFDAAYCVLTPGNNVNILKYQFTDALVDGTFTISRLVLVGSGTDPYPGDPTIAGYV